MKAIILAAGRGSRMRELTESRPKCLVNLRGRPLLEYQIDALSSAGIEDVAIVTGYCRDLLLGYGLKEFQNKRWSETNMVSSLECADEWLSHSNCIVSYSDIFYDEAIVQSLMNSVDSLAIAYDKNWLGIWERRFNDPLSDAESFQLNSQNELIEIGNKVEDIAQIQGQYMGLLKFTPLAWQSVKELRTSLSDVQKDVMDMTATLQLLIKVNRLKMKGIPNEGEWGEIDSINDLACYM